MEIEFQPMDEIVCAPVVIIDDTTQEMPEDFELIFTIPGGPLGMPAMLQLIANITIIDNDMPGKLAYICCILCRWFQVPLVFVYCTLDNCFV